MRAVVRTSSRLFVYLTISYKYGILLQVGEIMKEYWDLFLSKMMSLTLEQKIIGAVLLLLLASIFLSSLKIFILLTGIAAAGYFIYFLYKKARE